VVQATIWDADTGGSAASPAGKSFVVRSAEGKVLPAQKVNSGNYWGHSFVDLIFPATVEALGHAAYVIEEGSSGEAAAGVKTYEVPPRHEPHAPTAPAMENELLAVEFDATTGGVVKLLDKTTGRDLADRSNPLGVLEFVLERPRGMSAWIIGSALSRRSRLEVRSLERLWNGPHAASVAAKLRVENSDVTITYTLKATQPWLEILVETTWLERGSRESGTPSLRMLFPLDLQEATGRYEIPFGSIQRDLNAGQEVPALRWVDVAGRNGGTAAGCCLMNDSKYGHSLNGSTLGLTLIRSSYEPDPLPEIGEHVIRLAVAPHGKDLAVSDLVRMGASFNHPLLVVSTDVHGGRLPAAGSAATSVAPGNVILSSVKKAEDEDAIVFRLYDTAGKTSAAKVTLDAALFGRPEEAQEVDLLERPVEKSTARTTSGGFSVSVPGHGIASVLVKFAGR
jgi:alpha-mannosidase